MGENNALQEHVLGILSSTFPSERQEQLANASSKILSAFHSSSKKEQETPQESAGPSQVDSKALANASSSKLGPWHASACSLQSNTCTDTRQQVEYNWQQENRSSTVFEKEQLARPAQSLKRPKVPVFAYLPQDRSRRKVLSAKWTAEQDAALCETVERLGAKSWKTVSTFVPGKDHVQCLQRWKKVLQPGLVKGSWTKEEDEVLKDMGSKLDPDKPDWQSIANVIQGRTAKQCRERWRLNLDPSINRAPFTAAEDRLLLSLHETMGSRWTEIKEHFKGRTENSVKTRFKSLMRSKARDWSEVADLQLMALHSQTGDDWEVLARAMPGRSVSAIKLRVRKLQAIRQRELNQLMSMANKEAQVLLQGVREEISQGVALTPAKLRRPRSSETLLKQEQLQLGSKRKLSSQQSTSAGDSDATPSHSPSTKLTPETARYASPLSVGLGGDGFYECTRSPLPLVVKKPQSSLDGVDANLASSGSMFVNGIAPPARNSEYYSFVRDRPSGCRPLPISVDNSSYHFKQHGDSAHSYGPFLEFEPLASPSSTLLPSPRLFDDTDLAIAVLSPMDLSLTPSAQLRGNSEYKEHPKA